MAAGNVTIDDDGTESEVTGLAGDLYTQRKASILLVNPPGAIPLGSQGVPVKRGIAVGANADATAIYGANGGSVPTGTVLPFAGTTAPNGYLFCDGSAVSTTTYAALFAVIGTTYGGAGPNFNLPDLRARVPVGRNNGTLPNGENATYSTRNLAATGGEETHVLSTLELAAHAHTSTTLVYSTPGVGSLAMSAGADYSVGGATSTFGSNAAHNNMQPFVVLNYIIRT